MMLRLLENAFVTQNIASIHFYSCDQVKLLPGSYHHFPGSRKIPVSSKQQFLKIHSQNRKWRGEGNHGAKEMTKINLVRVLAKSFVKSHHLCTLHVFLLSFFVVP